MRTVVTGGAGFIGSNLVDALLARGDSVTVVDNFASGKRENLDPGAALLEHDIREPFAVEADVVFHLAAQADVQTSMQRPGYDAAVNVVGTVNVLAAAPGAQVIFASSGGAGYGECAEPATEQTPFLPLSPYGIAKKCGEEYLAGWNRIHGTRPRRPPLRERLRAAAGLRARGRRRRDLPRAAGARRGDGDLRRRHAGARLRLRRRHRRLAARGRRPRRRPVQRRDGPRHHGVRPARRLRTRRGHRPCAAARARPARRRAALRPRRAPDRTRSSAGGRASRSTTGSPGPGRWMQEHAGS